MDETRPVIPLRPAAEPGSVAASAAASAPARPGFTLRGRRWAYAATLAVAGVLPGSGVAYAVVPTTTAHTAVSAQRASQERSAA